MDSDTLARFMFNRQAEHYATSPEEIDAAWRDPGVQTFWRNEAAAVLGFLESVE